MVSPSAGTVILIPFPFSDLSKSKLRPAVVLADVGRDDWILCQVTSNPYSDRRAIELLDTSFETGSFLVTSYARPGKLFTANQSLMVGVVGRLNATSFNQIIEAVITILRASLAP
ncbi:MAG: type II toxin-antitoxin system PemK/MazF family toxin [Anaerolineae bacterium]|nr:type II toxin-antitoxin system PemK/MazF family toxin [Anaerolineae bacterium]